MFNHVTDGYRKARKPHTCWACNGIIKKGDRYEYEVNSDDHIYELKFHYDCLELMAVYGDHFPNYDNGGNYPIHEWAEVTKDGSLDWVAYDGKYPMSGKIEIDYRAIMQLPDVPNDGGSNEKEKS